MISEENQELDPEWRDKTRLDMQLVIADKDKYILEQMQFHKYQANVVADKEVQIERLKKENGAQEQVIKQKDNRLEF